MCPFFMVDAAADEKSSVKNSLKKKREEPGSIGKREDLLTYGRSCKT